VTTPLRRGAMWDRRTGEQSMEVLEVGSVFSTVKLRDVETTLSNEFIRTRFSVDPVRIADGTSTFSESTIQGPMRAFGYTFVEKRDFTDTRYASDRQLEVLEQQRRWRELKVPVWKAVCAGILDQCGAPYSGGHYTLNQASILLEFWIKAPSGSKKAAENFVLYRMAGQGELFE
jgi:hypothetical protein